MKDPMAVTLSGVTCSFGRRRALIDIDLALTANHCHGLVGPNGSGKSTLLRLLAGLLIPDSGAVNYPGLQADSHRAAIKQHVAYVAQEFALYRELTIEENLAFVADLYSVSEPTQVLSQAQTAFDLCAHRRHRAAASSGGVRQRLMLAAAFMRSPKLLLLDEPTAALDDASRDVLWRHIGAVQRAGTTILLTTHSDRDLARCDSVTTLVAGRIVNHSANKSA
jgi:ABC-2 type transport system ATP-binding protein